MRKILIAILCILLMSVPVRADSFVAPTAPEDAQKLMPRETEDFGEGLLLKKKKAHEDRIRQVTGIPSEQSCRIVTYFSNIDNQAEFSSDRILREAVLLSGRVPMQEPVVNLSEDSVTKYVPTKAIFEQKV